MIGYDPIADFAPITLIGLYPLVMVVPNTSPVHSVKEFIAYAKTEHQGGEHQNPVKVLIRGSASRPPPPGCQAYLCCDQLVVNAEIARMLSLTVWPSLLARADEVIA